MRVLLSLMLVAALLWLGGFVLYYQQIQPVPEDSGQPCEALVVLTGSAGRVEAGFRLLEAGRAAHLFITGVGDDAHSEAFLARYKPSAELRVRLKQPGILTIDRAATSTFENADETQRWLEKTGFSRLCLVTAHYHMPRSLKVFRAAMPDKHWVPIATCGGDVKPEQLLVRLDMTVVLMREYHKWLFVTAMQWLS